MNSRPQRDRHRWTSALVTVLIMTAAECALHTSHATVWYVDGARSCSNSGPGNESLPFCTIGTGAQRAGAGDTVRVSPAFYREQVTLPASGSPESPITFEATAPGAIVMGSIDVSDSAAWSPTSTNAWRRILSSVPRQIWVDGARLATATGARTTTPGSFFYDSGAQVLYVDIGGASPGGRAVEATTRSQGFYAVGLSNLVIQGFWTKYQNSAGIRLSNASGIILRDLETSSSAGYGIRIDSSSGPILIEGTTVSGCGSSGISLSGSSGVTVRNNVSHHNESNGIGLQSSTGNLIERNVCYANARTDIRAAVGIDVNGGSSTNIVRMNTVYSNQDSGINVYNGSNNVLVVRNISYDNGDHGFDTVESVGTSYVSNTSFRNTHDGFSVEGRSTSTALYDNIAVDNGIATGHYDLYVDPGSRAGLSSDWNVVWNSTAAAPVKVNGTVYSTFSSYRSATGLDMHSLGADPRFANSAAPDLHPGPGSPAIDSADSNVPGFLFDDRDGTPPLDDPSVQNSGAGAPAFADRGGLESRAGAGGEQPPIAVLRITPSQGWAPLVVSADASASTDMDTTPIADYTFDFGDGTIMESQAGAIAYHTYTSDGTFTVLVTVTDTISTSSTAAASVLVRDDPPVARLSVTPTSGTVNLVVTANASGSSDTDGTPIASYTFDFGDGVVIGPQVAAIAAHTYVRMGAYTIRITVADTAGKTSTVTRNVTVKDDPPHAVLKGSPRDGLAPLTVTFNASESTDRDGTPIASYTFDFKDGTIVGPQASPVVVHTYTVPADYKPNVTVRDTAGLSASATADVKVKRP